VTHALTKCRSARAASIGEARRTSTLWVKCEMNNRYLRVILLPDGETVHNAFFDRGFVA
jgi:hypothetical protein